MSNKTKELVNKIFNKKPIYSVYPYDGETLQEIISQLYAHIKELEDRIDGGIGGGTGAQGPMGPMGPKGDRGPRGEKGDKGDRGPRGERGPMGLPSTAPIQEIVDAREDTTGYVHFSLDKRIDSEVANLKEWLRILEEPAKGKTVTIEKTLEGTTKDMVINGDTMRSKNLFEKENFVKNLTYWYPGRVTRMRRDGKDCLKCLHLDLTKWSITLDENKSYTIRASILHEGAKGGHFQFNKRDGSVVKTQDMGVSDYGFHYFQATIPSGGKNLKYTYDAQTITYFDLDSIQLEEGLYPTTCYPYGYSESVGEVEGNVITLKSNNGDKQEDTRVIQLPQPLRRAGDIADRVYESGNKVYFEQNVADIVLDGDEDISLYVPQPDEQNTVLFNVNIETKGPVIFCDKFPVQDKVGGNHEYITQSDRLNHGVCISVDNNRLTGLDAPGFKKWLSTNPVTLTCALQKPIVSELEAHDIDLNTYKGITYIDSENELKPTLEFKTLKLMDTVILSNTEETILLNDKIDGAIKRIEVIETALKKE